ncbi:MAG: S4 domain-containing protein, partial [Actinomycetota bacterium]|nr:S4 domain-containing protein [Actinomycetota bacterium]
MIEAGRVTVNGDLATLGDKLGANDRIELDGVPV